MNRLRCFCVMRKKNRLRSADGCDCQRMILRAETMLAAEELEGARPPQMESQPRKSRIIRLFECVAA